MRRLFCLLALTICTAQADPVWLTVLGDPLDPAADTVQVDVTSAVAFDRARIVTIRANRAQDRPARDGLPFRSYVSSVLIDCDKNTARHRSQELFTEPLWRGAPRTHHYQDDDVRTMAFRGMEASPQTRIVRAACSIDLVQTR